jgi:hypothetical protein
MSKAEAEKRLAGLKVDGLVQRCEPISGSFNFLLVRLNQVETDAASPKFDKGAYEAARKRVKAALQDIKFELANSAPTRPR